MSCHDFRVVKVHKYKCFRIASVQSVLVYYGQCKPSAITCKSTLIVRMYSEEVGNGVISDHKM